MDKESLLQSPNRIGTIMILQPQCLLGIDEEPLLQDSEWNWEDNESYAPQRSGRFRGRLRSPDTYMFNSTIWIRHDSEASAHMHEDPIDCLRDRVIAMEHNLDTLRDSFDSGGRSSRCARNTRRSSSHY